MIRPEKRPMGTCKITHQITWNWSLEERFDAAFTHVCCPRGGLLCWTDSKQWSFSKGPTAYNLLPWRLSLLFTDYSINGANYDHILPHKPIMVRYVLRMIRLMTNPKGLGKGPLKASCTNQIKLSWPIQIVIRGQADQFNYHNGESYRRSSDRSPIHG